MPKLHKYEIFKPEQDFLAFPDHYVNIVGYIEFANLQALSVVDESGKRVIKRGTVVNMDEDGKVTKATNGNGNGIIFDTIEVDRYDEVDVHVNATVMIHGFVRKDRLQNAAELKSELIHVVNR